MPRFMTQITVEAKFLRIPTHWSLVAERVTGGLLLVPKIGDLKRPPKHKLILDLWELRDEFLRLKHTPERAQKFLTKVGLYRLGEAVIPPKGPGALVGAFGSRFFRGVATPLPLEELWRHQAFWKSRLSHPQELQKTFGAPPGADAKSEDHERFAAMSHWENRLPIRVEWKKGLPVGVIEAATLREALMVTTHLDLISSANFQICKRPDCRTPFTGRKREYCYWYCGHIEQVRRSRRKDKDNRRKEKSHVEK